MCKTRLEAVDDSTQTEEDLFGFARNFAAEADRQELEIERLNAELAAGKYRTGAVCGYCSHSGTLLLDRAEKAEAIVAKLPEWAEQLKRLRMDLFRGEGISTPTLTRLAKEMIEAAEAGG